MATATGMGKAVTVEGCHPSGLTAPMCRGTPLSLALNPLP